MDRVLGARRRKPNNNFRGALPRTGRSEARALDSGNFHFRRICRMVSRRRGAVFLFRARRLAMPLGAAFGPLVETAGWKSMGAATLSSHGVQSAKRAAEP